MAFIKVIQPKEAVGNLKRLYDEAVKRAGYVAQVIRLMSLNPGTLRTSMMLYVSTMYGPSPLSRQQREMIATVVSRLNHCHY